MYPIPRLLRRSTVSMSGGGLGRPPASVSAEDRCIHHHPPAPAAAAKQITRGSQTERRPDRIRANGNTMARPRSQYERRTKGTTRVNAGSRGGSILWLTAACEPATAGRNGPLVSL